MIFFLTLKILGFLLYNLPNINSKKNYLQQLSFPKLNLNLNLDISKIEAMKKNYENELLFLLNKRVKVNLHIEQLIQNTNIYHIGISFDSVFDNIRYDLRGYNSIFYYNFLKKNLKEYTYQWGYTDKTLHEIKDYEIGLNYKYILGFYDCRHYVRNLTTWTTNHPTPVWKLNKLIKKIETN
tara:strand:+ start:1344 stop:1886 length:543 start_codon:yes stop_codon:yes gene_type:complete